jgi:hypothetical protein
LIGVFASSAHSAVALKGPVGKEVTALRETILELNGGNADIDSAINMFTALQMRVIGGNDDTWKSGHPNWTPVFNQIRDDFKKDLGPVLSAQARASAALWDHALAAHLSPAEVEGLTRFYSSTLGRRYLAFQERLMSIEAEGSSSLVVGLASGGGSPAHDPITPPSQARMEARQKLIALSWISQWRPLMETASGSPGPKIGGSERKSIDDAMDRAVAETRGAELDELLQQYEQDFDEYSAFQSSSLAKALLGVYAELAKEDAETSSQSTIQADFKNALETSVQIHTPTWKSAYEVGREAAQTAK